METIIIYKDYNFGILRLFAGVLIAKNKTCKIRPFKSGHFRGGQTLIKLEDVVLEINLEEKENIEKVFELMKKADHIVHAVEENVRELQKNAKKEIEELCEKIKIIN